MWKFKKKLKLISQTVQKIGNLMNAIKVPLIVVRIRITFYIINKCTQLNYWMIKNMMKIRKSKSISLTVENSPTTILCILRCIEFLFENNKRLLINETPKLISERKLFHLKREWKSITKIRISYHLKIQGKIFLLTIIKKNYTMWMSNMRKEENQKWMICERIS